MMGGLVVETDEEEAVLFIRFAFENPYYTKVSTVVTGQIKQCQTRCNLYGNVRLYSLNNGTVLSSYNCRYLSFIRDLSRQNY